MDTSLAALLVRVVVSLAVVLVVMWGAATVLRRSGVTGTAATGRRGGRRKPPVEVIARHGLSRGASVTIVRLGGRALVLGVTEHQVSLLTEVDPAELDTPVDGIDEGSSSAGSTAGPGIGSGSLPWKVALEQLRERTVRRS
jgi:flagellar biogenesis protein FliO